MFPCPLEHCSIPMYDSEWHKNRQCALWLLDDEQRFDYYEHIEDAKTAKYKAKIEYYKDLDEKEISTANVQQTIEHGRFFFYDTIIPQNNNLQLDPKDFDEHDIFHDDYEDEQYDEDYIGFSTTEELCSNLSSASIITKSLKFFSQQANVYHQTKAAKHFFFDSKDDAENELLVNLFQEVGSDKPPSVSNKPGLIQIINNKLNQQQRNEVFDTAVNELQSTIYSSTNNSEYNQLIIDFLEAYPDATKPKEFFEHHNDIPYEANNYIEELFKFDQQQYKLQLRKDKTRFKIVYLTSGGGKTTLAKQHNIYLDIDAFIARHYNKFKLVDKFCQRYKNYSLMSLFFKHTFWHDIDFLQGKIILCNHPNQLPNQFRLGYNEMVLIPDKQNWDIRWFNENYFSLLAIQGKIKYLSSYDNYGKIIFNHFIKFKKKDFIDKSH